jgi:hypothetical protein
VVVLVGVCILLGALCIIGGLHDADMGCLGLLCGIFFIALGCTIPFLAH